MKKASSISILGLIVSIIFGSHTAWGFSDVKENHKNYEAITYLQESGVIKGYEDGTFKPDNKVNRAEFLKIILKGSNAKLDVNAKIVFSDVSEDSWYAPYIKKAKKENWIKGYGDGTFKPNQSINKVEALKILGKVQGWEVEEKAIKAPFKDVPALIWYAPYVEYASNHGFLEETGDYFHPSTEMTRAKISEIIYRTTRNEAKNPVTEINSEDNQNIETSKPIEEPPEEQQELNFTPVQPSMYSADYFDKVILKNPFPNTFYKNEIYTLEGEITSGDHSSIFAFLSQNSTNINFTADVSDNKFKIDLKFAEIGNFSLGIIPGDKGTSKVASISILPTLPNPISGTQIATKATSLSIDFKNDQTTLSWKNPDQLTKLLIYQKTNSRTYIFRQPRENYAPDYKDFENFMEGAAYFKIKTAKLLSASPITINSEWTESATETIQLTTHQFSEIKDDKIIYSTIPDILETPQKITFSGTTNEDLLREASIILPSGQIEEIKMTSSAYGDHYGSETILKGNSYTFEYIPAEEGTHIIELNEKGGYAVINKPVYIGKRIPLIPDFFDKYEQPELTTDPIDITQSRDELLKLINETRANMGLAVLTLSDELNTLAQNHTNDMIINSFFAHVNKDGKTPDDRKEALKIKTEVGENLAKTASILYAHEGLLRSAVHRQNIIDPLWTRIGIGIAKDSQGYFIVTEEFSTSPLQQSDLDSFEKELLNLINEQRTEDIKSDTTLKEIAAEWSTIMAEQDFLGFTAPDNTKLADLINERKVQVQIQAFVVDSSNLEGIKEKIMEDTVISESKWKNSGLSIKLDTEGKLKFTLLYTP